MKRIKWLFPILVLLLSSRCHKECDAFSGRVLSGAMETYFGVYKPGSWWVYQNRDSTKRDSIYLVSFVDSLIKDQTNCTAYSLRKFSLHNNQLANMNDIAVVYDATETAIAFKMEAQNTNLPSFSSSTDSLIRSLPAADNPGNNKLDSVRLNGASFYKILTGKRTPNIYYFGKDRGLVGWMTPTDTFNLVNFRFL